MSFLHMIMLRSLLCGITHAQHTVGEVSVITKCAVSPQKLLIVPRLQKLLQQIIPVQALV